MIRQIVKGKSTQRVLSLSRRRATPVNSQPALQVRHQSQKPEQPKTQPQTQEKTPITKESPLGKLLGDLKSDDGMKGFLMNLPQKDIELSAYDKFLSLHTQNKSRSKKELERFFSAVNENSSLFSRLLELDKLDQSRLKKTIAMFKQIVTEVSDTVPTDPATNSRVLAMTRMIMEKVLDKQLDSSKIDSVDLLSIFQIFTKFPRLDYETMYLWQQGQSQGLLDGAFEEPFVVSTVLPLYVTYPSEIEFDVLWKLYNEVLVKMEKKNRPWHVMTSICYLAKENEKAQKLLDDQTANNKKISEVQYAYILPNIKDTTTAEKLIETIVEKQLLSKFPPLGNLLDNIWEDSHDFTKIEKLWTLTRDYNKSKYDNDYSGLDVPFLKVFFKAHEKHTPEAFEKLKGFADKITGSPIVNTVIDQLTYGAAQWHSTELFNYAWKIVSSTRIPITNKKASWCPLLEAAGSVNLSTDAILDVFRSTLSAQRRNMVSHEEWMAFRKATVAAPLCFEVEDLKSRLDLYFKAWKLCSPYFMSLDLFKECIYEDIHVLNKNYSKVYRNLHLIEVDFGIPELKEYKRNLAIESYMGL
ncbi:unnamed protein product [Ambrosiozyma monospora]|uniref:Unnamed protein product n=1 Tax=Ambrosiozyma monospora TaxID=43982 RepID=A0ACB5SYX1_AMBMO|nr:unnamed protein product [Ambrosiozyma monospora]